MYCGKNDLQHAGAANCFILLSVWICQGDGFYTTPENLWQAAKFFPFAVLSSLQWIK